MDWNWHKIPPEEHAAVIEYVKAGRWGEVAKLCEQYDVSFYCCCNAEGLQNWARWAIEKGIINAQRPGKAMVDEAGRDGGTVIE